MIVIFSIIVSILLHLDEESTDLQSICLSPTQELSSQHYESFKLLNTYTKFNRILCQEELSEKVPKGVQVIFGEVNIIITSIKQNKIDKT